MTAPYDPQLVQAFRAWKAQQAALAAETQRHRDILTKNEAGKARDLAEAPSPTMLKLSAFSDAVTGGISNVGKNAYNALMAPVQGNEFSGRIPHLVVPRPTEAITPEEFTSAGAKTAITAASIPMSGYVAKSAMALPSIIGRIGGQALGTGAVGSAMQGAETLVETRDFGKAGEAALNAFVPGMVMGTGFGVLAESPELIQAFRKWKAAGSKTPNVAVPAGTPTPVVAPIPVAPLVVPPQPAKPSFLQARLPTVAKGLENIRTARRTLLNTAYAGLESENPALVESLHKAGASGDYATHVATTELDRVLNGLTPEQESQFTNQLLSDTFAAKAERNVASLASATEQQKGLQMQSSYLQSEAQRLREQGRAATKVANRAAGRAETKTSQLADLRSVMRDVQAQRDAILGEGATHADIVQAVGRADEQAGKMSNAYQSAVDARDALQKQIAEHQDVLDASNIMVQSATTKMQSMAPKPDGTMPSRFAKLAEMKTQAVQDGDQALVALHELTPQLDALHTQTTDLATQLASAEQQHAAYRSAFVASKGTADVVDKQAATEAVRTALRSRQRIAETAQRYIENQASLLDRQRQAILKVLPRHDANIATLTQTAENHTNLASLHGKGVPDDITQQPWFTNALSAYKTKVEQPLQDAYLQAGGTTESLLQPKTAYLRGVDAQRLARDEIDRAMKLQGVKTPQELSATNPALKWLSGERPELTRGLQALEQVTPEGVAGLPAGPNASGLPMIPRGATATKSAQQALGTAQEYSTDIRRITAFDAADKLRRAATNDVYNKVAQVGRVLEEGEEAFPGQEVLTRLIPGDNGAIVRQRISVDPDIKKAIDRFESTRDVSDITGAWRRTTGLLTKAQIAGMPVEASSHANTIASIIAAVPGELTSTGRALTLVPGVGARISAIRDMIMLDFANPEIQALQNRLAKIGALRIEVPLGGVINTTHNMLFGPTGVDVRGRLVLAQKYLRRAPNATDEQLRDFITSKLGNYVRANSGELTNALQTSGISAFARFQAARIPTSIATTFGQSGLPTTSALQKAKDVAETLYRGPVGYAAGAEFANNVLAGQGTSKNEAGQVGNIQTGLYAEPGGLTGTPNNRPTYVPMQFLNPVLSTGLRATGVRNFIPGMTTTPEGSKFLGARRDIVNTALGTLSPAMRFLSSVLTGRVPYQTASGDLLKTSQEGFGGNATIGQNLKDALIAANPATSAFGSERGNRLADAFNTGPSGSSTAQTMAEIAEVLLPRLLAVGKGDTGARTTELNAQNRQYTDGIASYRQQLQSANTPAARQAVLEKALSDAKNAGFNVNLVQSALLAPIRSDELKYVQAFKANLRTRQP